LPYSRSVTYHNYIPVPRFFNPRYTQGFNDYPYPIAAPYNQRSQGSFILQSPYYESTRTGQDYPSPYFEQVSIDQDMSYPDYGGSPDQVQEQETFSYDTDDDEQQQKQGEDETRQHVEHYSPHGEDQMMNQAYKDFPHTFVVSDFATSPDVVPEPQTYIETDNEMTESTASPDHPEAEILALNNENTLVMHGKETESSFEPNRPELSFESDLTDVDNTESAFGSNPTEMETQQTAGLDIEDERGEISGESQFGIQQLETTELENNGVKKSFARENPFRTVPSEWSIYAPIGNSYFEKSGKFDSSSDSRQSQDINFTDLPNIIYEPGNGNNHADTNLDLSSTIEDETPAQAHDDYMNNPELNIPISQDSGEDYITTTFDSDVKSSTLPSFARDDLNFEIRKFSDSEESEKIDDNSADSGNHTKSPVPSG